MRKHPYNPGPMGVFSCSNCPLSIRFVNGQWVSDLGHIPNCVPYGGKHEPKDYPPIPPTSAHCQHKWQTERENWMGGGDSYEVCTECGTVQDQTIPPTSAPKESQNG
jgi:hypothetical protein